MPDLRPNGAYASHPDVALVHTVYGEPVEETARPNTTGTGIELLPNAHFRNYEPPKPRLPQDTRVKNLCASEGCRAYRTATGHCAGHSRSLGLIPNWNKDGRKHEPE
jgi:hypothetical protein